MQQAAEPIRRRAGSRGINKAVGQTDCLGAEYFPEEYRRHVRRVSSLLRLTMSARAADTPLRAYSVFSYRPEVVQPSCALSSGYSFRRNALLSEF